jgi:hypothetical protein
LSDFFQEGGERRIFPHVGFIDVKPGKISHCHRRNTCLAGYFEGQGGDVAHDSIDPLFPAELYLLLESDGILFGQRHVSPKGLFFVDRHAVALDAAAVELPGEVLKGFIHFFTEKILGDGGSKDQADIPGKLIADGGSSNGMPVAVSGEVIKDLHRVC